MKIQIKSRFTAAVLFEHDTAENTIKLTLEAGLKAGADLYGANLRGADLRGADLSDANLGDADIDFSCLPLRCGGLRWKIDKRQAAQLAYHLCSMQCDDKEFLAVRNFALGLANQFHRVSECGKLEPVEAPSC